MKNYESFILKNVVEQKEKQTEREKEATNEKERKIKILKTENEIREMKKKLRELRQKDQIQHSIK